MQGLGDEIAYFRDEKCSGGVTDLRLIRPRLLRSNTDARDAEYQFQMFGNLWEYLISFQIIS